MSVGRLLLQFPLLRVSWFAHYTPAMERHPARASASVVLRKDEMVRLERAHFGKEIHAQEGLLWITGSGTGDILLRSGESFLLDDKGPFLVQGLVDSRWHLLP